MSPVDIFLAWLEAQPAEIRETLSFHYSTHIPTRPKDSAQEAGVVLESAAFVEEWMASRSKMYFRVAGQTLLFRSLTAFVIRNYDTQDGWDIARDHNDAFMERLQDMPDRGGVERFQAILAKFPERSAMWIKAAESWKQLANSSLSDEAIDAWLQSQMGF